jgi:D-alanine-D-alanine ligase
VSTPDRPAAVPSVPPAQSQARVRVVLLYGGRSTEHAVSCLSAASAVRAFDQDHYEVVEVGITRDGSWVLGPAAVPALTGPGRPLPEVDPRGREVALRAAPGASGRVVVEAAGTAGVLPGGGSVTAAADVVFPLLHGPFGEDGTVQGLLALAGVPYVGSGVFASAASMDKIHMKRILTAVGLPVGPWREVPPELTGAGLRDLVAPLGLPLFVKPARGGSSVGITRVTDLAGLDAAVATARDCDSRVLVEAAVVGREIECGVLQFPDLGLRASLPAEVLLGEDLDFYDFEAKYLSDAVGLAVPAELTAAQTAAVQELSLAAFRALDCAGLARVDFFLTPDGLVVNEVNTMPGFTPASLFPRMWEASGVAYGELVDVLVRTALVLGPARR